MLVSVSGIEPAIQASKAQCYTSTHTVELVTVVGAYDCPTITDAIPYCRTHSVPIVGCYRIGSLPRIRTQHITVNSRSASPRGAVENETLVFLGRIELPQDMSYQDTALPLSYRNMDLHRRVELL